MSLSATNITPRARLDAGQFVLILLLGRWLAGMGENFGVPHLSEVSALLMLGLLALWHIARPQMARAVSWFCLGCAAWAFAGLLSIIMRPEHASQDTVALLLLLGLYATLANSLWLHTTSPTHLHLIMRFCGLYLLVGLTLSLLQIGTATAFVDPGKPQVARAFGSDVHPVSFGLQLVAAGVGFTAARLRLGRTFDGVAFAILTCGIVALWLTYARTAWGMAALVCLAGLTTIRPKALRILLMLTLPFAGFALIIVSGRLDDLASLPVFLQHIMQGTLTFDHRFIDNSISWRIINWGYGLTQAMEAIWLGHGPGQSARLSAFNLEMHNLPLEVLFETGLVGLVGLMMIIGGFMRLSKQLAAKTRADWVARRLIRAYLLGLLLAVLVSTSLVDQLMTVALTLLTLRAGTIAASPARTLR